MTYPYPASPYGEGQRAFDAGVPIDANPHDPNMHFAADDYPGDSTLWRWGWLNRMHTQEHTNERRA